MYKKTIYTKTVLPLLFLAALLVSLSFKTPQAESNLKTGLSLLDVSAEQITLRCTPPESAKTGILELEIYSIQGQLLAKVTRIHQGVPLEVSLITSIDKESLADYYLRWRFDKLQPFQQRSLLLINELMEITMLGQRQFFAGTSPVIRVLVRDRAAGTALAGAKVAAQLSHENNIISKFIANTDINGEVAVKLDMPPIPLQKVLLKVTVSSQNATETIEEPIDIISPAQTLLTTDKPIYQPGQTIHIRALSLAKSDMKPLANTAVTFEVEDSKGNKVFKKTGTTDNFGISHTDFVLADELNEGNYRVTAIVAAVTTDKTVRVERYVLPKFKIDFKTDNSFYQPGQTLKGDIQTDYFFGKPLAGAKVQIKCAKFDVQYTDFQTIQGKTDDNGHYSFELTLPEHFVGQPLQANLASVKFDIDVTDTADHKETITKNVTVTASPIIVAAIPESGQLIPNLPNKVYIITTYADSTPAQCKVTCTTADDSKPIVIETDNAGFGEITISPQNDNPVELALAAQDKQGHKASTKITLDAQPTQDDDSILLRTDKSIYLVGQQLDFNVFTTRKSGTVYIDVIKDQQTHLTRTLSLSDGESSGTITLDPTLAGTLQINAYLIGANGIIVRDRRLVLVNTSDDLNITVTSDQDTYLPGSNAKLLLSITDKNKQPTPSAVGVIVVDEAVYALQETQPGLEKIYFYLEQEITKPRYEVHGYDLAPYICRPEPIPAGDTSQTAARALLASATGTGDYPLHVHRLPTDKLQKLQHTLRQQIEPLYEKIQNAIEKFSQNQHGKKQKQLTDITLQMLVKNHYLNPQDIIDPWGNLMKLTRNEKHYPQITLASAGIDGKWDTADDILVPDYPPPMMFGGDIRMVKGQVNDAMALGAVEMAGVMEERAMKPQSAAATTTGAEPIRIRQFFPETLYFNPAVITDSQGHATLDIPIADSITTWRMTSMASSAIGQLGSNTTPIRVFQDFFVDIDFPVALTQNDQVSVPVAIYNYLKTDQKITLQVEPQDWFELKTTPEKTVTLAPAEVTVAYFPIVATKPGLHKFTVTARGTEKSDAIARSVQITPDGKEYLISHSGRLDANRQHSIIIPDDAIEDASKIFVKLYPALLSQVIEGLDKMLRMPFGCFEQTSSVTYPNILILDYMKTTGKITPELQMKAETFINAGYQQLLSFEVEGGGFEWFGKAPAHRILTAYGLMEFYDMAKVHPVDPAIITRTQRWLADCQEKNGSYSPTAGGITEGAIDKFTDDIMRNTAYITWALAATEYNGPEIANAIKYIHNNLDNIKDTYTRALVLNALATVDPKDKITLDIAKGLYDERVEKDDIVYWQTNTITPTCGTGSAADIETTALAIQGLIRCQQYTSAINKAVTYLVKNKDAYGTWQSTQATIQALRAMLMAQQQAASVSNAAVEISVNGKTASTVNINSDNSDLLQLIDLQDFTGKGNHDISLEVTGESAMLYQIIARYYIPWPRQIMPPQQEPLTIDLNYDRTELATDDIISVSATVTNNQPGRAKMVIVDLALPPGFTLIPDGLNQLVEKNIIEKYSLAGRGIIIYIREIDSKKSIKLDYQLRAKFPLKAQAPPAIAYEYYNPSIKTETAPVPITVN